MKQMEAQKISEKKYTRKEFIYETREMIVKKTYLLFIIMKENI